MSPNTADHTWPITLLTFRQNITKESVSSTITLDLLSASPDKLADHQGDRRQKNAQGSYQLAWVLTFTGGRDGSEGILGGKTRF